MRVKQIIYEDMVNYKKPSMFIGTMSCNGKCCIEANIPLSMCQNDSLRNAPITQINDMLLIEKYLGNPITKAIVIGGLEPFEQFNELFWFLFVLRNVYMCNDDVVIYTGYYENELASQIDYLKAFPNIIIKFGRYIPDNNPYYDELLGVELASDNQYAKQIS